MAVNFPERRAAMNPQIEETESGTQYTNLLLDPSYEKQNTENKQMLAEVEKKVTVQRNDH